jgi:CDP-glycerol glycerophosphotransferase (TagB/SpsB family)
VGCTYLDVAAERIKQIPGEEHHPFTVLVFPSWGKSALLSRYGENLLDPLVETGWRIIARPHPQSQHSEKAILERLFARYKAALNLEWDYECENIYAMAKADVMINDYSGITFDYAFLCDKPVVYVNHDMDLRPYDAHFLSDEPCHFKALAR